MIPGSSYTYILRLGYLGNQDTLVPQILGMDTQKLLQNATSIFYTQSGFMQA